MKTLLPAAASLTALVLWPAPAPGQSRTSGRTHTRQIFVSVTNKDGAPIKGLAAVEIQTTAAGAVDVTVARDGVLLRVSEHPRGQ